MASGDAFQLWTQRYPRGELRVASFRGREQVSVPYVFDLVLRGEGVERVHVERDLVGQPCLLRFRSLGEATPDRCFGGIVARIAAGSLSAERHIYRLRLRPRLWLAKKTRDSRIFQHLAVPQIVEEVLRPHRVALRWKLERAYEPREYCVQYQESDLGFVERLLSEEGIHYAFEHDAEAGAERVVFCDRPELCDPIDMPLPLVSRDSAGMVEGEGAVGRFRVERRVQPGSATLTEFDFTRPSFPLSAESSVPPEPDAFDLSLLRVRDHHGQHSGLDVRAAAASLYLEQARRRAWIARGKSHTRAFAAGRWFTIEGAAISEHDGDYTVVHVEHEGATPELVDGAHEVYKNRILCVPRALALRPRRPAARLQQVLETATVVGPAGQEIHTDALGRIRVQFHWDRQGERNERSSCWIRVAQTWAGAGWGFQFIPRIGMEVLVMFVGGDVDRPMVLGCVPNAEHPPPFPLPQQKTRSGIKTQSTKGGDGYNEISFSDRKGFEELLLRAQKDMVEDVVHDKRVRVGGVAVTEIAGDDMDQVGGKRVALVAGDMLVSIGANRRSAVQGEDHLAVEGSRSVRVEEASSTTVHGDARSVVGGNAAEQIGGSDRRRVEGQRELVVHGASRAEVGGDATLVAGGNAAVRVARATSVTSQSLMLAVGDGTADHRATLQASRGDVSLKGSGTIVINAGEALIFRVGDKAIRINEDGIQLLADTTKVKGSSFVVETDKTTITSDEAVVQGGQAAVELKDTAKVKGTSVSLKGTASPASRDSASSSATTRTVRIDLFDREGQRIDGARYRVSMAGLRREGTASGGVAEFEAPEDVESVQLEWGRPEAARPEGASRAEYEYRSEIFLAVDHDDADEAMRRKLSNLGIRAGSVEGMKEIFRRWKRLDRAPEAGDVDPHLDGSAPVRRKEG
jgi:type VI secretion system secreted protein VgrG